MKNFREQIVKQFPVHSPLPTWILLFIFACLSVVFILSFLAAGNLPKDFIQDTKSESFVAQNAYEHVKYLAEGIGTRPGGTAANEILTVNYILAQIELITQTLHAELRIDVRHEQVEGSLQSPSKRYKFLNIYRGVQNIVVKLEPKDVDPKLNYILMNAHFDTVPLSPGAGDDASMVAVMLEILRVFSRQRHINHPLVFLFNGAEEYILAGTDGFIHQNEWMPKVGVLVNLESAGPGGRELLFQVRDMHPWLMTAYVKVPNPFAATLAEEVWNAGLVQSDTDFTNFKLSVDRLPAMDLAYAGDGNFYHTKYDDMRRISLGSLQHTGTNVERLLKELDQKTEIDDYLSVEEDSGYIFFDYLGLFFIFYTQLSATIINSTIFVLVSMLIAWSAYQIKRKEGLTYARLLIEFGSALMIQLLAVFLAFLIVLFIAWALDASSRSMTWYSHYWLIFGIYICPFFFGLSILPYIHFNVLQQRRMYSKTFYTQLALHGHCTLLSVLLIVLTIMKVKSAYLIMLSTSFYFVSTAINACFRLNKGNKWIYLHCAAQIIPCFYYFYTLIVAYNTLIPTGARAYDGATTNPELAVAFLTGFFIFLSTGFYAPVILIFKHRKYILGSMLVVFGIFLIILMTPVGFPYREDKTPQRYTVWHTKREFFNHQGNLMDSDSGYYVYAYDRHGAGVLFDHMPIMSQGSIPFKDCEERHLCGQPWHRINMYGNREHNYWIPAEEPSLPPSRPQIRLDRVETDIAVNRTRFHLSFAGSAQMNIQIVPLPGAKIVAWTLTEAVPIPAMQWKERDLFFILYLHGVNDYHYAPFEFSITVETHDNWHEPYTFDMGIAAHFIDGQRSDGFIDFIDSFPKWTNVQNWSAYYGGYQF